MPPTHPVIHIRLLAPTTYIFFASALPVIAFGEQLSRETGEFGFPNYSVYSKVIRKRYNRGYVYRWKAKHGRDAGFHCTMRDHTLDLWRPAPADFGRGGAHHCHVFLHVQLREREERFGPQSVLGVDRLVGDSNI